METKILIVDDEQDVRDVIAIALSDMGYEVYTAESGEEAMKSFKTVRPPIVLTDIKMPGIDGIELLRRIKQENPDTEVIMATGHGAMDLAIMSLKYAAADFITKPINVDMLDVALKKVQEKITATFLCDARKNPPIVDNKLLYDFVSAHHCTDVAAIGNSEWPIILGNVASLVKPGGWLSISVTTGSLIYTENGNPFPCISLTEEEIRQGYLLSGFEMETFMIQEMIIPKSADREYSGMKIAIAQKLYNFQLDGNSQ